MYEKRRDEMICPKDGKPTFRIARFLKPNARNINKFTEFPTIPLISDIFTHQNHQNWPQNVHFTGWNKPNKNYMNWFNKLVIKHATTWIEVGIIDGIQASLHEIPCNKELVLGVCEFWCPITNTFMFPWGEATITLEDVMILGGLPVIGEPINSQLAGSLGKIEEELKRVKWEFHKGGHDSWVEHFMEEEEEGEIDHEEGELEHVAFLALWLSMFVLPDLDKGIIGNHVFAIAIHLSKGTPVALAPVVLANLYHELTLLTHNAVGLPLDTKYYASDLFKIVQLWVCERFPELASSLAKPLGIGDPRVARWDNVGVDVSLSHVWLRLKEGQGFLWRPYACDLENWDHFPFYEESEQTIKNCAVLDDCLLSYGRFLCSCEIVGHGANCREKYLPYRVAMQFGYDQDIPREVRNSVAVWDKGGLYIPSRNFNPGVSRSYSNWWKDSMLHRKESVDEYFRQKRGIRSGGRLVERQDSGKCRAGNKEKGSCASPRLMLDTRTCVNKSSSTKNDFRDLDKVPLGMRMCSNSTKVVNKKDPFNEKMKGQTSAALKSPQIKVKRNRDSNDRKGVSVAEKPLPSSDSVDIDHVPLALRLQSIVMNVGTLRPSESYASTENVGFSIRRQPTEEFASPGSDADSHITRKGSSSGKTTVEADREVENNADGVPHSEVVARLSKLERVVANIRKNTTKL